MDEWEGEGREGWMNRWMGLMCGRKGGMRLCRGGREGGRD